MKIIRVTPFILHVPVTRSRIADSTHSIDFWGAPGVILETDTGLKGTGYTGTHAFLPADRLIADCIANVYGPVLISQDPTEVKSLWLKLNRMPPVQWVGRGGIATLAHAAIDLALWDLRAQAAEMPLWKLLGGSAEKQVKAYNTDGGWLNWSQEQLVEDCRRIVGEGFRGVKIKVGSPNPVDDLRRIEAVRRAIGMNVALMVDANGRWDLPTAIQYGKHFADFGVQWFEEPLWYDDVSGHAALAQAISTPIALGEQLYLLDNFKEFIRAGAVHYVQADAVRLAGITEWWQAADLAWAHRLPVAAHIGDMMQVHLQLSIAHPACSMLEYIPWMRECFEEPATVVNGFFQTPQRPGAGSTLKPSALEQYNRL